MTTFTSGGAPPTTTSMVTSSLRPARPRTATDVNAKAMPGWVWPLAIGAIIVAVIAFLWWRR